MALERLRPLDALKTYRYLRLGMIGAVVLLAVSILIESSRAENAVTKATWCLQDSISAYYYTPVRAIFIASMFVIAFSLIVYKGHDLREDFLLNVAGMLAPIVAVIPTTTVGDCWSIEPDPLPVDEDGSLAGWVVANLDNNIDALLIVGSITLLLAFVVWRMSLRDPRRRIEVQPGTKGVLIGTAVALMITWLLKHFQRDLFLANAHGKSAILLILFLWLAILANVLTHWRTPGRPWVSWYVGLAALMVVGIPISFLFGTHQIFALEAWEIAAFATYWIVQTVENWDEKVVIPDRRDEGIEHVARS